MPTLNTGVAGTGSNLILLLLLLLLFLSRDKRGLGLGCGGLGCDGLSGAVGDLAVPHETLDQPVVLAIAEHAAVETGLAEVEIAIVAGAAMVVLIRDSVLAVVAVDGEVAMSWWGWDSRLIADGVLAFVGDAGELCKPFLSRGGAPSDGDLGARRRLGHASFLRQAHAGHLSGSLVGRRAHHGAGTSGSSEMGMLD
jgi:hypothetical protein